MYKIYRKAKPLIFCEPPYGSPNQRIYLLMYISITDISFLSILWIVNIAYRALMLYTYLVNKNVYRRLLQLPIISIASIYIGFEIVHAGVLQHVYTAIKGSIVGQAEALQVKNGNSQTLEAIRPTSTRKDNDIPAPSDESLYLKPVSSTADDEEEIQEQSIIYEVKASDTIASVAKMFDVSKDTIRWANNLKTDVLKPGQVLMILPITGVVHEIKKGDTIETISKKYKADKDEVYRYNGLNGKSELAVGDVLIIPDGKKEAPTVNVIAKKLKVKVAVKSRLIETYTNNIEGYYTRPLAGGTKTQGLHGHNGIDIGASIGTPILAAADGVVTVARPSGYNGGYGQMIIIKHANGTQTVYGHLSAVSVIEGQAVSKGETIGALGNTGKSTGPHLHFEVRGAVNPF